jgi:hypothetical protein
LGFSEAVRLDYHHTMLSKLAGSLSLALWFGGGVVAGFVAPQAAFGVLADRQLAGSIAGSVLSTYGVIVLVCGGVYLLSHIAARVGGASWSRLTLALVVVALIIVAFSQFVLTPQIADLRAQMREAGVAPEYQGRFGAYHQLSVIFFAIQWLLATVALVRHTQVLATRRH